MMMCDCRAQFVLVMLVLFTVTLPLLVVAYVNDSGMAVVITVITTSVFWTVNEVARDVEDAFIMEPNSE
jgi:cell division protein FtsW (lipid II flippase)